MSKRNRPEFIESVVALLSKGTKTAVHDAIIANSVYVLNQFEENDDWIYLKVDGKATVRDTQITDFNIYPEKTGKQLTTTAIINLKHDVRFRR